MTALLSALETEYAFAAWDRDGERMPAGRLARRFSNALKAQNAWLPAGEGGWFLGNGARLYWDAGEHPEYATPECGGHPKLLVAQVRAGHEILSRIVSAVAGSNRGGTIRVWRGNVDYLTGQSWGCHENYLTQRTAEELAPDILPHLVSRVIYGGAGGFSPANLERFSLSPRLELFTARESLDTMTVRGIVNTRSEHHAVGHRRLHLICRDSVSSQTADLLSIGMTRLIVALTDRGKQPGRGLQPDNAVGALHGFCRDPSCRRKVRTETGRLTAVDIQRHYLDAIDQHRALLPDWTDEIVTRCAGILDQLADDPRGLSGVLDWPTKLAVFESGPKRDTQALLVEDVLLSELNSLLDDYLAKDDRTAEVVSRADILEAISSAPDMTRARLRGEAVKRFSGQSDAICSWSGVLLPERSLCLSDPWEQRERWRDEPLPPRQEPLDLQIPAFLRRQR